MTREELQKMIENHQHWINEDCDGWENMRADLRRADLRRADMGASDLKGADMRGVDMREANLHGVDLSGVDMREANLKWANLKWANLSGADLRWADLREADMSGVDLRKANLSGADLRKANLSGAKNIPYIPMTCPDEGLFIGWKKCKDNRIVKLEIPEDARRSSATGRKCRCDKARVLLIESIDRSLLFDSAESQFDSAFVYRVGEMVSVFGFCEDRFEECAPGIHFFINRQEAVEW